MAEIHTLAVGCIKRLTYYILLGKYHSFIHDFFQSALVDTTQNEIFTYKVAELKLENPYIQVIRLEPE